MCLPLNKGKDKDKDMSLSDHDPTVLNVLYRRAKWAKKEWEYFCWTNL